MTMVSILMRYKGSRDSTSNHKRSSLPYAPGTAVRLFGSGAKNRNGVRPLRSRVLTICHNILNDYSVLWTRTKSGGYVRTRRRSLEVSFCDKYTIGEKLGSGGFGTVYAAVRNSNGAQARRIRRRGKRDMELLLLCLQKTSLSLLLILLGPRWRSSKRQGHVYPHGTRVEDRRCLRNSGTF